MKLSHKLIIIGAVPMLAFFCVCTILGLAKVNESLKIVEIRKTLQLSRSLFYLSHELQTERGLTNIYVSGGSIHDMNKQRQNTDKAYQQVITSLAGVKLEATIATRLQNISETIRNARTQANNKVNTVSIYTSLISQVMDDEHYLAHSDINIANNNNNYGFSDKANSIAIIGGTKEYAGVLRAVCSGILTANKPVEFQRIQQLLAMKGVIDSKLQSREMHLEAGSPEMIQQLRTSDNWKRMDIAFYSIISKYATGDYGTTGTEFFRIMTNIIEDLAKISLNEYSGFEKRIKAIQEETTVSLITITIISGLIFIVLSIVVHLIRVSIQEPIYALINYADSVSKNKSGVEVPSSNTVELNHLSNAISSMVNRLREMMSSISRSESLAHEESERAKRATLEAEEAKNRAEKAKAEGMLDAATHIEAVVKVVDDAVKEMQTLVREAERGATRQADQIDHTSTAMEEMNITVLEVAKNAGDTSNMSAATRERAEKGTNIASMAIDSIEAVRNQSLKLKEDMARLDHDTKEITQIMGVISDIADQTNLLALNAAIEAARAGEAGRGFAVVADEVRKLAEKTMTSTAEVGKSIKAIQDSATESIQQVDNAVNAIQDATDLVNQSGVALQEIVDLADTTADQIRTIATAAEEQSATSDEINRSLMDVNNISADVVKLMQESNSAIEKVASQSNNLLSLIATMKNG